MSRWTVVVVAEPQELVAASDLFDREVTLESADAFLRSPGHLVLLAKARDGTAVGFVSGVEMRHPDKEPEMFAYELGVREDARRRGVAQSLLVALAGIAADRGHRGLWTATEHDNEPALATYRSLGAAVDAGAVLLEWNDLAAVRRSRRRD
jgi:aminoglycoside 3-N-acetyltransferase I